MSLSDIWTECPPGAPYCERSMQTMMEASSPALLRIVRTPDNAHFQVWVEVRSGMGLMSRLVVKLNAPGELADSARDSFNKATPPPGKRPYIFHKYGLVPDRTTYLQLLDGSSQFLAHKHYIIHLCKSILPPACHPLLFSLCSLFHA